MGKKNKFNSKLIVTSVKLTKLKTSSIHIDYLL